MNFQSHTPKEILGAQRKGEKIWQLDTGNSGNDDFLIGEEKEVLNQILSFYELENLPEGWELTLVDYDIEPYC